MSIWTPDLLAVVRRQHVDEGLSAREIGRRHGLSKASVEGALKRHGWQRPKRVAVPKPGASVRPAKLARHHIDWSQLDGSLRDLRDEGLGPKFCAPILGVAEGSIRRRVKQLKLPKLHGGQRYGIPTGRRLSAAHQAKLHAARVASGAYERVSASLRGHAVSDSARAKMLAAALRRHAQARAAC